MEYITLVKGDDTNFVGDQYIKVNFTSDISFTGFSATFTLCGVTVTYNDISSKSINIVLDHNFTSALTKGKQFGELKIIDSNSRVRTVTSVIPFLVIDSVKNSPTYQNEELVVQTEVNETTIDITIETAGISMSEAENFKTICSTHSQNAANSASQAAASATRASSYANTCTSSAETCEGAAETCETIQTRLEEAIEAAEKIGDVADLATTAKNTTVAAINEVLNTLNTNDGDLTILQTSAKNNLVSAINELVNNKANLIWYANRDFEYKAPNFIAIDKTTITIKAGTAIKLANGSYYYTSIDDEYSISDILDFGTVSNGKDYYFYMNNDKEVIASLSETIPANSVLIGGGHTLCVSVTSSNAPTLLADSLWSSHPAIGYDTGHFIPNTAWTPAFKSGAKTGNKGMALIDFYGIPKFWVDIYLQSGTGNATASDYSGTITNNRQCILHQWDMGQVGKKLPTDQQFSIFAEGSNNQTNIAGSAIPSGRLTGGYTDTAGKRMISGFFIECCCGYLWQWGDEIAPVGGSGWASYGDDRRGQSYGMPYVLLFGGGYDTSSSGGSWSRTSPNPRSTVNAHYGGRGVSLHIEREHK